MTCITAFYDLYNSVISMDQEDSKFKFYDMLLRFLCANQIQNSNFSIPQLLYALLRVYVQIFMTCQIFVSIVQKLIINSNKMKLNLSGCFSNIDYKKCIGSVYLINLSKNESQLDPCGGTAANEYGFLSLIKNHFQKKIEEYFKMHIYSVLD